MLFDILLDHGFCLSHRFSLSFLCVELRTAFKPITAVSLKLQRNSSRRSVSMFFRLVFLLTEPPSL